MMKSSPASFPLANLIMNEWENFMFGLGPVEIALVAVAVLVLFGPASLPKIGQSLGKGIREFKDAADGVMRETQSELNEQNKDKQENIQESTSESANPTYNESQQK